MRRRRRRRPRLRFRTASREAKRTGRSTSAAAPAGDLVADTPLPGQRLHPARRRRPDRRRRPTRPTSPPNPPRRRSRTPSRRPATKQSSAWPIRPFRVSRSAPMARSSSAATQNPAAGGQWQNGSDARRMVLLPTYAITDNIIFNAEIEFEHARLPASTTTTSCTAPPRSSSSGSISRSSISSTGARPASIWCRSATSTSITSRRSSTACCGRNSTTA